jgi:uncharacterized protein YutE (UPF0331/DUF86 family)
MTDTTLVLQKLTTLREHVARVQRRRPEAAELMRRDLDLQDAIAMSLLVAIQEAIDIAFHLIADEGWGVPSSYAESFEILARRGVIEPGLAGDLVAASGLRNRLADGYASVDVERIWREIPTGIAALERYATAIARFLPGAS